MKEKKIKCKHINKKFLYKYDDKYSFNFFGVSKCLSCGKKIRTEIKNYLAN